MVDSLPGALGMFGLSIGVANVGETLPRAVYALLSGLNAATVGIVALAAVDLSGQAITDTPTRIIVFLTASAGMLYNALWYFPVLMSVAGCITVILDYHLLRTPILAVQRIIPWMGVLPLDNGTGAPGNRPDEEMHPSTPTIDDLDNSQRRDFEPRVVPQNYQLNISWKIGLSIVITFFITFVVTMVVRGVLPNPPLLYRLFSNLYLAGTVIFGGGPVVVPLLREYVVAEGWVSPRDFLIGLAVVQAFPGPNFNFAVYLGSLTSVHFGYPSVLGAVISFFAIFLPGIVLVHGTMGIWGALRSRPWVKSVVRGINAAAVGLIYTAVYRIWQVGYLDQGFQSGRSLGDDPWWVVVTATSYVGGRYFNIVAPLAIMLGGSLGLVRYGIVG